jgi:hypothetical protein
MGVATLFGLTASPVFADADAPALTSDAPPLTIVPVVAPRKNPPPIPHSDVLDPNTIQDFLQSDALNEQYREAAASAEAQDLEGEPGVLDTTTGISAGLTLYDVPEACSDFDRRSAWEGEVWTMYFDGWGNFAADDGYYQAKNVTFDRELSVGPGSNWDSSSQSSVKIASNQPYEAGIMSPPIEVRPGRMVLVRARYLIYNHGQEADSLDYASMGIITELGKPATYVTGYRRGEWAIMELEVEAVTEQIIVMLQAHSPAALNSNIYFDNVEIYRNDGNRVSNCRR